MSIGKNTRKPVAAASPTPRIMDNAMSDMICTRRLWITYPDAKITHNSWHRNSDVRGLGQGMRKNLIEVEREQQADCARIDAAVRLAEQEFANLYRRDYGPGEMRRKWIGVRDRTILAVRDV